jgi:hypothetical protein
MTEETPRELREAEARRIEFIAMFDAAREEARRERTYTIEDVLSEMDAIISRLP